MHEAKPYSVRWIIYAALLTSLIALSGCSTMIDPYVRLEYAENKSTPQQQEAVKTSYAKKYKSCDLAFYEASEMSQDLILAYQNAKSDYAMTQAITGTALITATAAAMGLALQGNHTNSIRNIGVAGAGVYGINSYLSEPSRLTAYQRGMESVVCAQQAVAPWSLLGNDFQDYTTALGRVIGETSPNILKQARKELQSLEGQGSICKKEKVKLNKSISGLETAQAQANDAYAKGVLLVAQRRAVAHQFCRTLHKIEVQVSGLLDNTLPSVTAIPGLLSSLAPMYSTITGSASSLLPSGEKDSETKKEPDGGALTSSGKVKCRSNDTLASELDALTTSLVKATAFVKPRIDAFGAAPATLDKTMCNVSNGQLLPGITIAPGASVKLEAKDGQTQRITLTGGNGKYIASPMFSGDKTPRVDQPVPLGPVFEIQVSASTQTGNYTVMFQDTTATSKPSLTITVAKPESSGKDKKPVPPVMPPSPKHTCADELQGLDSDSITRLQIALTVEQPLDKLKIDGDCGINTSTIFKKVVDKQTVANTAITTNKPDDFIKALNDAYISTEGLPKAGPLTAHEKTAYNENKNTNNINALRDKLGLSENGKFDKELRAALKAYQLRSSNNELSEYASGLINRATLKELGLL